MTTFDHRSPCFRTGETAPKPLAQGFGPRRSAHWLRTLALAGFLFFLIKGLAWAALAIVAGAVLLD